MWYIYIVVALARVVLSQNEEDECATGVFRDKQGPTRKLYYCGSEIDLTIQESDRLQHKLLNAILAVSFKTIGYENIKLVPEPNATGTVNKFRQIAKSFYHTNYVCNTLGAALVNIQVTIPQEYDYDTEISNNFITDLGDTGTNSQYSWYLHSAAINCLQDDLEYYSGSILRDCYLGFSKSELLNFTSFSGNNYVNFSSPYCSGIECPVVLSTSVDDTAFLKEHIMQDQLRFHVVWVKQRNDLKEIIDSTKSTFFVLDNVHWPRLKKLNVSSGKCFSLKPSICPYEKTRNTKLIWHYVNRYTYIYDILKGLKINSLQMTNLINEYRRFSGFNETVRIQQSACRWMKNEENINFTTELINKKVQEFTIVLLSRNEIDDVAKNKKLAIKTEEIINRLSYLRTNYILKVKHDTIDPNILAIKKYVNYVFNYKSFDKLIGLIMPAFPNDLQTMIGLSKYYQLPIITYDSKGPSFADRDYCKYAFRISPDKNNSMKVYLAFLKQNNWSRVAAISGFKQNNVDYTNILEKYLIENELTFMSQKIIEGQADSAITTCLTNLKEKNARIIIVDMETNFDSTTTHKLLCEASDMGMTGNNGFVWILPDWPFLSDLMTSKCNLGDITQVLEGHFTISIPSIGKNNENKSELGKLMNEHRQEIEDIFGERQQFDYDNAGFKADAAWSIALAFQKFIVNFRGAEDELRSGKPITSNMRLFAQYMSESDFHGISGEIKFHEGSINTSYVQVKQWFSNNSMVVIKIKIIADHGNYVVIKTDEPRWVTRNGLKPEDGTVNCNFLKKHTEFYYDCPDTAIFIFIGAIAALTVVFVILNRRSKIKMKLLSEKERKSHICILNHLHSHEVPREKVALEWEIGRGSFGKVFGGSLKSDDGTLKPVAVKILKSGSSIQDENDFLLEAKTMVSFDHNNIVKLLAVCTVGIPIYVIMELMLNQDLRRFLRSRRHMIGDQNFKERHFISDRGLTKMALDLAKALSYLAYKNFVHRDIASRNCMVDNYGVVKLGDFGMTRYVFTEGEYVCKRSGLFPVRWMAPESILNRSFTTMSDVWSYAIVLYEIISFGGTPYHDMSKTVVQEYILSGNVMSIPVTINWQLRALMQQCWSLNPSKRPTAPDIVIFLSDKPILLHPCLLSEAPHVPMIRNDISENDSVRTPIIKLSNGTTETFTTDTCYSSRRQNRSNRSFFTI